MLPGAIAQTGSPPRARPRLLCSSRDALNVRPAFGSHAINSGAVRIAVGRRYGVGGSSVAAAWERAATVQMIGINVAGTSSHSEELSMQRASAGVHVAIISEPKK